MVTSNGVNRRAFLAAAMAAPAALAAPGKMEFCVFSKHLHFLNWDDMAAAAKEIGFEGVDLTVRKGGHVTPDRVTDDLPKAAAAIRAAGLKLTMITTDIGDMSTPHAERVLRTAKGVGVTHYRWDGFRYKDGVSLPDQLKEFAPRVRDLAAFNKQLGLTAMYHTHSGAGRVGASVAESLVSEQNDITVVDTDVTQLRELQDRLDLRTVPGNGTHPSVLERAGAADADMLIATAARDETNLVACQLAARLFNVPTRIARIRAPDFQDHPEITGDRRVHKLFVDIVTGRA